MSSIDEAAVTGPVHGPPTLLEYYHAWRMTAEERDAWEPMLVDAMAAAKAAYAPHSGFSVGASVETVAGNHYSGCNIENASYGLTNCGERNAIGTAQTEEGHGMQLSRVAVWADAHSVPCCGACRQVIVEFGPDAQVAFLQGGEWAVMWARDLLPITFEFAPRTPGVGDAAPRPRVLHPPTAGELAWAAQEADQIATDRYLRATDSCTVRAAEYRVIELTHPGSTAARVTGTQQLLVRNDAVLGFLARDLDEATRGKLAALLGPGLRLATDDDTAAFLRERTDVLAGLRPIVARRIAEGAQPARREAVHPRRALKGTVNHALGSEAEPGRRRRTAVAAPGE